MSFETQSFEGYFWRLRKLRFCWLFLNRSHWCIFQQSRDLKAQNFWDTVNNYNLCSKNDHSQNCLTISLKQVSYFRGFFCHTIIYFQTLSLSGTSVSPLVMIFLKSESWTDNYDHQKKKINPLRLLIRFNCKFLDR